jgi:HK97 family phage prohead protease
MEHKTTQAYETKVTDEGIVETVFAVMGNVDLGNDVLHPGAFAKTFTERGHKVKVLDHHQARSVRDVIGKPLELRELPKEQLPQAVLDAHPDATGGAWARVQFLMDTPEGEGAFKRIKAGAIGEWSFGYDALDKDFETIKQNGQDVSIRNLRTVKLYELSPVIWAMNDGTMTLSAKESDGAPSEEKPWNVFEQDGQFCVYQVNVQSGKPTGEALGCHETQEEALEQIRALYASEGGKGNGEGGEDKAVMKTEGDGQHPASHYLVVEDAEKPSTWHLRVRDADGSVSHRLMGAAWAALHGGYRGNRYQGPGKAEALAKLKRLYEREGMDTPKMWTPWYGPVCPDCAKEVGPFWRLTMDSIIEHPCIFCQMPTKALHDTASNPDWILKKQDNNDDSDAPAEEQAADDTPEDEGAGPDIPPTSERLALIAQLKRELELLEV